LGIPFFKSIRTHLLLLVLLSVLPALGIVIYTGINWLRSDVKAAHNDALRVLQSLANDHQRNAESTRQLLTTLAKLPDVQNRNAAACNRLFRAIHKENPMYTTILASDAQGMIFANALPFTPYSVKQRKYFQDSIRTKDFSAGEYMIGIASGLRLFPFAYPVLDSRGRVQAVVMTGIALDRYGQMFAKTKLPEGSVLAIFDHKNVRLYRSDESKQYTWETDSPEMIARMSAKPDEGLFTSAGVDGVKRLYAYKRFYLEGSTSPYLFMRVGIPEERALAHAKNTMFITVTLLCAAFILAVTVAWFLGKMIIVQRLDRLADTSLRLGHGDLTARTGLEHSEDELGQVTKAFDDMAGELEHKESERKSAEDALRESEEKYRGIFENAVEGIYRSRPDGRYIDLNPAFARIFGYDSPQELMTAITDIGRQLYVDPKKRDECTRAVSEQGEAVFEVEVYRKDGSTAWVSNSVRAVRDAEGNVTHFEGVVEDITERKRMEEELRKSEEKYRSLATTADSMYLVDREYRYLSMNEGHLSRFNLPLDKIIGRPYSEFHSQESTKKFVETVDRVFESGRPIQIEHRSDRDGRYFLRTFSPVRGADGKETMAVTVVSKDITVRKQTEEALRESEEKYRTMADSLPQIIFETDLQGRFTFVNRAASATTGYTQEEFLTELTTAELIAPEDRKRARSNMQMILAGEESAGNEYTCLRKDGSRYPVSIHSSIIIHDNQIVGLRGFVVDITQRKQMEGRLRRAEKMEALGTLAGGVAHDLNNVLGVLVGYSELLLMEIPEEHPWRKHVSQVMRSSQRATAMIQDLLTMARRGVLVSEVVNLNEVITNYLESPEFEKLKSYHPAVVFKTELGKDLLNVKGSPVHLGKTLTNLVSNASEAISDEGTVTIRTEARYLDKPIRGYDEVKEGDYVVLTVSDNGMGISVKDIEKIFEPFYTKKVMGRSGTGLGLAVVWGSVKDHNGYIDVKSEAGKGSTFTIYLPATREELTRDEQTAAPTQYMGKGESILVVDDVTAQREVATSILTKLSYKVDAVSGGEAAVEYLRTRKADLVVLDMIMDPGIDGLDTYKRILEINPKQKAIIVSGFSETDRIRQAQALGAGEYVKKPYLLEKLGLAVRRELVRQV
jgi:PAS domain S-box-containing protein